jgi:hypothetical protein
MRNTFAIIGAVYLPNSTTDRNLSEHDLYSFHVDTLGGRGRVLANPTVGTKAYAELTKAGREGFRYRLNGIETVVFPAPRKNIWEIADVIGKLTRVPTTAWPETLYDIEDFRTVITGTLPELRRGRGDVRKTPHYGRLLSESCARYLTALNVAAQEPWPVYTTQALSELESLQRFFPTTRELSDELEDATRELDVKEAWRLVNENLAPVLKATYRTKKR